MDRWLLLLAACHHSQTVTLGIQEVLGKIVLAGSTDADFAHFEEGIADHQKAADEEAVVRLHQEELENAKKVKTKSRSGTGVSIDRHPKGLCRRVDPCFFDSSQLQQ